MKRVDRRQFLQKLKIYKFHLKVGRSSACSTHWRAFHSVSSASRVLVRNWLKLYYVKFERTMTVIHFDVEIVKKFEKSLANREILILGVLSTWEMQWRQISIVQVSEWMSTRRRFFDSSNDGQAKRIRLVDWPFHNESLRKPHSRQKKSKHNHSMSE